MKYGRLGITILSIIIFNLIFISGCQTYQKNHNVSPSPIIDRIQQRGTLILGTSADQPPLSQLNQQGTVEGFDVDIAKMMASAMDVKLKVKIFPFKQLLYALEHDEVDIVLSNLTITPVRNLKVAFVGPYMTSGKCILTKNTKLADTATVQKLNNSKVRITAQKETTSEHFVKHLMPKAQIHITENNQQAVSLLRNDKVDLMITDFPICLSTINNHPEAGFISATSLLTYEPIGVALPANDALFINWMGNFLQRLDDTNTLDELGQLWFGNLFNQRTPSVTM